MPLLLCHLIVSTIFPAFICEITQCSFCPVLKNGFAAIDLAEGMQARTQGGVRWVRTNPPLRSQLQNDSAPFLNKLSI